MIELIFSALITVFPDYLFRRYRQGKRLGHEINLFNFWYELRWGITGCATLAITLITVIFYFHPTSDRVTSLFRTVTILSDRPGRVEAVYVSNNEEVRAGDPIFSLDTSRQRAAAETARRRIEEVEAALVLAASELDAAKGGVVAAGAALQRARDDLARREEAADRNSNIVSVQELEGLRSAVRAQEGALKSAEAQQRVVEARIAVALPAQRESAVAQLAQAETEITNATVTAGVDGVVKQFFLKPGDIVNPILRPAGILVPYAAGRGRFVAGFDQIAAQILRTGMIMEMTCPSLPLTVIRMTVTDIQEAVATGQFRPADQLVDVRDRIRPGTIMALLEPIEEGAADAIPPGSLCVAVAYTSHEAQMESGEIEGFQAFVMTIVDGMAIANALVIRAQALLLPIRTIVFSG